MNELSPTLSKPERLPPVKRELLWQGGTFGLKKPKRLQIHNSKVVGHPYAQILWRQHPLVRSFLHQGNVDLKNLFVNKPGIYCTIKIWENTEQDGTRSFIIDYTPVETGYIMDRIRMIKLLDFKEAEKWPKGMTGTVISICMPQHKGFIVIGEKAESV